MKNKFYLNLAGLILLCLCLYSCTEQVVKVKSLSFTNKYYLQPNDTAKGSLMASIQVELPESYVDEAVRKTIRNTIVSELFGKDYVEMADEQLAPEYFKKLISQYRLENEPLIAEFAKVDPHYVFNQDVEIEGFTTLNDGSIYSYGLDSYEFAGGAHGVKKLTYYNFDMKDGRIINEIELFSAGYERKLTKIIKQQIILQSEVLRDKKDLEQSDFWVDSIKPNSNFYISDEGITYVYNPAEIAPYYYGITEVLIPYSAIKDIMLPGNPASYLATLSKKEDVQ